MLYEKPLIAEGFFIFCLLAFILSEEEDLVTYPTKE